MPFVKRDESGAISAIYDRRERQIGEELAADHPEISEFLERLGLCPGIPGQVGNIRPECQTK